MRFIFAISAIAEVVVDFVAGNIAAIVACEYITCSLFAVLELRIAAHGRAAIFAIVTRVVVLIFTL